MKQIVNSNIFPEFPNIEIDYHKPIDLFIDSFLGYDNKKDSIKILWVKEAEEISGFKKLAIEHSSLFDFILTYEDDILKQCKNSYFIPFGTTWIHNYDIDTKKKFQISHITGHKEITEGHKLRKKIHYKQDKINIPKDFYISKFGGVDNFCNNKILGEKKEPVFESQFHICIENSKQKNFFTEKLIDCFVSKTVPIYYGCDNIGDFFNLNGMFVVNSLQDIIDCCNKLTDESYNKMLPFIEKNLVLSQKYIDIKNVFKDFLENTLRV